MAIQFAAGLGFVYYDDCPNGRMVVVTRKIVSSLNDLCDWCSMTNLDAYRVEVRALSLAGLSVTLIRLASEVSAFASNDVLFSFMFPSDVTVMLFPCASSRVQFFFL